MFGSPPPTCSNEARRYGVIMMDTLNYDKSIPLVVLLRCGSLNIHQLAKMSSPFFSSPKDNKQDYIFPPSLTSVRHTIAYTISRFPLRVAKTKFSRPFRLYLSITTQFVSIYLSYSLRYLPLEGRVNLIYYTHF